jgi:hypothetical protein
MKYIYSLLLAFIAAPVITTAQFTITTGYSLSLPQQGMNKNINGLHSIVLGGTYQLPGKLSRIRVGAELGWGTYASNTKEQTFTFTNGYSVKTDVNYGSNVTQGNLNAKVMLLQNKPVMPYISGKIGYAGFYSNIYIEDPNDPLGCKALDERTLIKDGTFTTAYGGGLQIDWGAFGKNGNKGKHWIDVSVHQQTGGNLNYINTKKLYDSNNSPTASDGKPLNVKFINASTNEIHEHQIAEVFTTPLRMLEIKVAAVFAIR